MKISISDVRDVGTPCFGVQIALALGRVWAALSPSLCRLLSCDQSEIALCKRPSYDLLKHTSSLPKLSITQFVTSLNQRNLVRQSKESGPLHQIQVQVELQRLETITKTNLKDLIQTLITKTSSTKPQKSHRYLLMFVLLNTN